MDEYTMTWSDAAREEATTSALGTGTWAPVATGGVASRDAHAGAAGPRGGWLRRLRGHGLARARDAAGAPGKSPA